MIAASSRTAPKIAAPHAMIDRGPKRSTTRGTNLAATIATAACGMNASLVANGE